MSSELEAPRSARAEQRPLIGPLLSWLLGTASVCVILTFLWFVMNLRSISLLLN
jgi:hypothetical protein